MYLGMEPPHSSDAASTIQAKVDLLAATRTLQFDARTVFLGQFTGNTFASKKDGQTKTEPGYLEDPTVRWCCQYLQLYC